MLDISLLSLILYFILIFTRVFVLFKMIPLVLGQKIPFLIVLSLSSFLAYFLFNISTFATFSPSFYEYILMFLIELLLGLFLGSCVCICGYLFELAGILYSESLDSSIPGLNSICSLFISAIGVIAFLSANGHQALIGGLYYCFELFPPGFYISAENWTSLAKEALKLFSAVFACGVLFSAPLLVASLFISLGSAFIKRFFYSGSTGEIFNLRPLLIHLVFLGILWKSVSYAVGFLLSYIERITYIS